MVKISATQWATTGGSAIWGAINDFSIYDMTSDNYQIPTGMIFNR